MSSRKELVGALRALIRVIETSDKLNDVRSGVVFGNARAVVQSATQGSITELAWTPFQRSAAMPIRTQQIAMMRRFRPEMTDEQIVGLLEHERNRYELWANSRYQVAVYRHGDMVHLSIKRIDNMTLRDWRDLQRIKDELVGPENEAVELFPARSRMVDTANQFHLWCLADPEMRIPVGFAERLVDDGPGEGGAAQRPFEGDQS